jgi:esterase/lipase
MSRGDLARLTFAALVALVFLGPRVTLEERWVEPEVGPDVEAYLAREEAQITGMRPGDEKAVVWARPDTPARTPLALVYLHGFSADRHEVAPLVAELADSLGANVYYARLAGHGRDGNAMAEARAEDWLDDGAEAMAVGRAIGERVVLIGTSTGGTLASWVASREEAKDALAALILISPNYMPRDGAARLLLWPWGGAIARMVEGEERCFRAANPEQERHWTTCYPTSALLPMMALAERGRTLPRGRVTTPVLTLYSPDDRVVDTGVTTAVFGRFASVPKMLLPMRGSTDPGRHVLAGDVLSPGTTAAVEARILSFLRTVPELGGSP